MNTAEGHISSTILLSYDVNPVNLIKAFFRPSKLLEDVIQSSRMFICPRGFPSKTICSQLFVPKSPDTKWGSLITLTYSFTQQDREKTNLLLGHSDAGLRSELDSSHTF